MSKTGGWILIFLTTLVITMSCILCIKIDKIVNHRHGYSSRAEQRIKDLEKRIENLEKSKECKR